jgi:hypothetical protein
MKLQRLHPAWTGLVRLHRRLASFQMTKLQPAYHQEANSSHFVGSGMQQRDMMPLARYGSLFTMAHTFLIPCMYASCHQSWLSNQVQTKPRNSTDNEISVPKPLALKVTVFFTASGQFYLLTSYCILLIIDIFAASLHKHNTRTRTSTHS